VFYCSSCLQYSIVEGKCTVEIFEEMNMEIPGCMHYQLPTTMICS
jgi:hypothetical protein